MPHLRVLDIMSWQNQGRQRHGWFGSGISARTGDAREGQVLPLVGQDAPQSRRYQLAQRIQHTTPSDAGISRPGNSRPGMPYVAGDPERWAGGPQVGSGECVALVQQATGAPLTSEWRRGTLVQGNLTLVPGTAIATFGPDDRYGSRTDGSSHAAIYLGQDEGGIYIIDQWNVRAGGNIVRRRSPATRYIPFDDPNRAQVDQGRFYHVVE